MTATVEELCIEHGLRMTGQRRIIARILSEAGDHPDVNELHRRAVLVDPNISLSTVYRTVRLFQEEGILSRIELGDGRARYEAQPTQHHHHLVDSDTGQVLEFHDDRLDEVLNDLAQRLGYRITGLRLEMFGVSLKGKKRGKKLKN
jgi:Fur family ferric uptake transcriptional regulator